MIPSRRRLSRRLAAALVLALILAAAGATLSAAGEYNTFPAYCHQHGPLDPLWWVYECWLPDPPGEPY